MASGDILTIKAKTSQELYLKNSAHIASYAARMVVVCTFGVLAGACCRKQQIAIDGRRHNERYDVGRCRAYVSACDFASYTVCFRVEDSPFGGLNSPFAQNSFPDRLLHLVLPVLTLTLVSTPKKYLLVRNQSATIYDEQYMSYARAKGLSDARLECVHTFPNISATFISMLGTSFGHMIAGSIIIEKVFSIDGVGMLVNRAISDKDFPMLQGALLAIAVSVIVSNFIADVIVAFFDPRQRRAA